MFEIFNQNQKKGAESFSAEQKRTNHFKKEKTAFSSNMMEKAVFSVEILTDFDFYVRFLAALFPSGVPLYADEEKITASASE